MLSGWIERGVTSTVVVDPTATRIVTPTHINAVADADGIPTDFIPQAIIFAVKPQAAVTVLPTYRRYATSVVFLSIMAGLTVDGMRGLLGECACVVRAMPNTPAAVRQGVTVATAGPGVSRRQQDLCDRLLQAVGMVAWVEQEALLDAVTAISGGGPAYVFLLTELLEKAAIEHGLPQDIARMMARQTVIGAGALLAANADDAADLRRAVTSPNGTTERALEVLMQSTAWPLLISRAVDAATIRSRELAS